MGTQREAIESKLRIFKKIVSDDRSSEKIDLNVRRHLLELASTLELMMQEIAEIQG